MAAGSSRRYAGHSHRLHSINNGKIEKDAMPNNGMASFFLQVKSLHSATQQLSFRWFT